MQPPYSGQLRGGTRDARAIALAGALAEAGVTHLEVEATGMEPIELEARSTDLPGYLADAGEHTVLLARGHTVVSVEPDWINWVTEDAEVRAALERAAASLAR